ncbi:MAG: hypothetical protein R6W89_11970 [Candidatus Hydrogenedentota bacterium]
MRGYWLCMLALVCASWAGAEVDLNTDAPDGFPVISQVRQITEGPEHNFFGYYGMVPWDPSEQYLVHLRSTFSDRLVEADDRAEIVLQNLETDESEVIAETAAWNFQQGSLVHWLDELPGRKLIYNDRNEGDLISVIHDVETGERRTLDRPVAAVSNDGRHAASISYSRLRITRPGYGYAGVEAAADDHPHPEDDGLYIMDLETGESELIVSLREAFDAEPVPEGAEENLLWFNHVLFSRDDDRIFFMARIHDTDDRRQTAGFTVHPDGSDLRCVLPYDWGASHYDWLDGERMVVTSRYQAETPWLHVFFTDGEDDHRPIAPDEIRRDGHCHFSPDGEWMLTDTYPDADRMQHLYIVRMEDEEVVRLGSFYQPEEFTGAWRCDLHPRWSRDGTRICIDSTHDGSRQVYVLDLAYESE